jgi:histidinol dehydrogenase
VLLSPLEGAADLVNRIAPEHVELAIADPDPVAAGIRHAGAVFFGRYTPEAVGDYVAGSNHVLPTSGAARFSSGLSLYDFLKRTSLVRCDASSFARLGPHTAALAEAEGLPAHARSARLRLGPDAL